jgi:putative protease
MPSPPELLAPAGGFDAALAAFQYGADAVYLGLPRFSARADADNLTPERLRVLLAYARSFSPPKKIYVTFNTLVQDAELPQAVETLDELADLAPDGVIVQDLGVARLIRDHFPGIPLHASTQLATHNIEGVLALKSLGFCRVVLARELTLAEIGDIARASGVEIEIFVHGALCYSVSGLCLFSSHTTGRSGNRGRCAYCCREAFRPGGGADQRPKGDSPAYPFSMRDLALAPLLAAVTATGVQSLKIEGRMKSPLYVACVTDYYRRKLDGALSPADEATLVQDLQTIFSRPWTSLYAGAGEPPTPFAAPIDPVAIGHRGTRVGQAEAVIRDRSGTRWLRFTTCRALEKHDGLQIELAGGGRPFGFPVNLLRRAASRPTADARPLVSVPAGTAVEVALPDQDTPMIPPGSPVFCSASQAVRRRYEIRSLRESELAAGRPAAFHVALRPDGIAAHAEASFVHSNDIAADAFIPLPLSPSRQPEQTPDAIRKAFERLGDTAWQFDTLTLDDPDALYAPPSKLNEARRALLASLSAAWAAARAARRAEAESETSAPDHEAGSHHSPLALRQPPAATPFSLKLRASTPPPPASALADIAPVILAIGHTPFERLEKQLADWSALVPATELRLALPLLTRAPEMPSLKNTLRRLIDAGWTRWECADLAGLRLLAEQGIAPLSADWTLYAMNRAALAELARLGIRHAVLSPENSGANLRALCARQAQPSVEVIAYQHTPLFISETPPAVPLPAGAAACAHTRIADRRGRAFTVQRLDARWITVSDAPFCIADRLVETGARRFRIDLSWSPDAACTAETLAAVRAGRTLPNTQTANFDRGFI